MMPLTLKQTSEKQVPSPALFPRLPSFRPSPHLVLTPLPHWVLC